MIIKSIIPVWTHREEEDVLITYRIIFLIKVVNEFKEVNMLIGTYTSDDKPNHLKINYISNADIRYKNELLETFLNFVLKTYETFQFTYKM